MKILVLGANGMIGSAILRLLSLNSKWDVAGTVRSEKNFGFRMGKLIQIKTLDDRDVLRELLDYETPDLTINCAGITKHAPFGDDALKALSMNAVLPHELLQYSNKNNSRLIHISSDCVFSGQKGDYSEADITDATDLYGRTKALGEITGKHAVTLRTSTIGHEIETKFGLLEWFLSQRECYGFKSAMFSGVTSLELATVIRDFVIPNENANGLYNLGSKTISKYDLLRIINDIYQSNVDIYADTSFKIDRSLNSKKFTNDFGYIAPDWHDMVARLHHSHTQES